MSAGRDARMDMRNLYKGSLFGSSVSTSLVRVIAQFHHGNAVHTHGHVDWVT